jgi:hypothetical protein
LAYAFRRCLSRPPSAAETSTLLALYEKETKRFAGEQTAAAELTADDPKHPLPIPVGATKEQLAAWTAVSRVLLNLDETITKE